MTRVSSMLKHVETVPRNVNTNSEKMCIFLLSVAAKRTLLTDGERGCVKRLFYDESKCVLVET